MPQETSSQAGPYPSTPLLGRIEGTPRRLGAAVAPCLRERTKEAAQLFFRVRSLHQSATARSDFVALTEGG